MNQIRKNMHHRIVGSSDLYMMVRAGFVSQGTSLNRWCIENGHNRQTVEKALRGKRVSAKSLDLVDLAVSAALPSDFADV